MQEAFTIYARCCHLTTTGSPDPPLLISPQICRCRGARLASTAVKSAIAMETKTHYHGNMGQLLKIAVM